MTRGIRLLVALLFAAVLLAFGLAMRTALARSSAEVLLDEVYAEPARQAAGAPTR